MIRLLPYACCLLSLLHGTLSRAQSSHQGLTSKSPTALFTENAGQWNYPIDFRQKTSTLDLHISSTGISYFFFNQPALDRLNTHNTKVLTDTVTLNGHFLKLNFVNAQPDPEPIKNKPADFYSNYFLGKNPAFWKSQVRSYEQVGYRELYQGINLELSMGEEGLKYDWVVKAGASTGQIKMRFDGATFLKVEYGELYIHHSMGFIKEKRPFAYQYIDGKRVEVPVEYMLNGNDVSFSLPAGYNHTVDLVIDPQLVFSTYSGSSVDNFGFTATYDAQGHLYAGGIATSPYPEIPGGSYPATPGAFQLTFIGGVSESPINLPCDITFNKYSADGSTLLYATYFGGSSNEHPHSLVVDKDDNLVLFGTTKSDDLPFSKSAYDTSINGLYDMFVAKFNASGSQLLGCTYVGGSLDDGLNNFPILHFFYADDFRGDVITDKRGNVLVGSVSHSSDFPVTPGSFGSAVPAGFQKAVIFKLSPGLDTLVFSSALGGDGNEALYSVDLGTNEDIFISGGTTSQNNFPGIINTYQGGVSDGFVAKIKRDGSSIEKATYYGTDNYDQVYSLELDKDENLYIVGQSLGTMPVSANVYSNSGSKQFIACLDKNFSTQKYATVFGSGRPTVDLTINAFLLDDCGRLYVSGWGGLDRGTGGTFGSTKGLPVSADAIQPNTDEKDFYLMVLGTNAKSLLYATYFGGTKSDDHVDGGTSRFDKRGVVYQSVCASCGPSSSTPLSDFPTSPTARFKQNLSPRCSNAAFKFDFGISDAKYRFDVDTCAQTIQFESQTPEALSFLWIFPDGQTSTEANPKTDLKKVLNKEVTLITNAGSSCADTLKKVILFNDSLKPPFVPNVFTPNNDGWNDVFRFDGIGQCDKAEIEIYNRWGQLMYESKEKNFAWDGKDKMGLPALEGVYYYIGKLEQIGKPVIKLHGSLTLLRN